MFGFFPSSFVVHLQRCVLQYTFTKRFACKFFSPLQYCKSKIGGKLAWSESGFLTAFIFIDKNYFGWSAVVCKNFQFLLSVKPEKMRITESKLFSKIPLKNNANRLLVYRSLKCSSVFWDFPFTRTHETQSKSKEAAGTATATLINQVCAM